ncbi:hypothetical protein RB195_005613 [Necator americanus]|uniref:Claspin n=1 Tax=Necator americanus TaxID=51031 RepID=A0ABR1BNQ5_NECAM
MEVECDGSAHDDTADSQASQTSTNSTSSLAIQFSAEDLQENNSDVLPPACTETVRNEGKARRLNRRLALANLQLPKLTAKQSCVVDLCTEEDRAEEIAWLKKRFPGIKTDAAKSEQKAKSCKGQSSSRNLPPSVASQKILKQALEKKLAERRRIGLAKRKELYMEDNEDLLDEEEEEPGTKKSLKEEKRVRKPLCSDEDSEEDEDYNGDDEEEEKGESKSDSSASGTEDGEEEGKGEETFDKRPDGIGEDLPESVDLFDGASTAGSSIKDSDKLHQGDNGTNKVHHDVEVNPTSGTILHPVESLNLMLDEDFDSQSTPNMTQPTFPNSLSQWFGDKLSQEKSSQEVPASLEAPEFVNIGTFGDMDPFKDSCEDDMLMLCSGRFDTQNLTKPTVEPLGEVVRSSSSPEDEEVVHATQKRKRKVIVSDDEDDAHPPASAEELDGIFEENIADKKTHEEDLSMERPNVQEDFTILRRTIVNSDSEESDKEEEQEQQDGLYGEEEEGEKEEEEEELDEVAQGKVNDEEDGRNYIEEEADDSDEELAVIRRLEKNEFHRKANRENWFDDEASLSGDDVGSDIDDDRDVANEYEAEEGDADDVPDSEAIRRQNHRLLLKQENDREHLELIKLQDRLLADGDLAGTETNRTFRLKLREDVTIIEGEDAQTEEAEEEEGETSSQAHARRVSAIKWLMEHEEEYRKICNEKEEDDIFDIAARSVQISSELTVNVVPKAPRTLLGQAGLANAIKELPGASCAKQLYVNNAPTAQKRPPSPPAFQPPKKSRSSVSVLSVLEQK